MTKTMSKRLGSLEAVVGVNTMRWRTVCERPLAEWPPEDFQGWVQALLDNDRGAQQALSEISDANLQALIEMIDAVKPQ